MGRDWEAAYQTGDTPWDKGEAAPPLLEFLGEVGDSIWKSAPVLVPGCGAGHDVRALAAAGREVVGYDVAPSAVKLAESFPVVNGERYELCDFLVDTGGQQYSGLWEHTCFCAILPEQRDEYAKAAADSIASGGVLAGVFYLNPRDPRDDEDGPPFGVTISEIKEHFAPWFLFEKGWVPQNAYPGREGREWLGMFRRLPISGGI